MTSDESSITDLKKMKTAFPFQDSTIISSKKKSGQVAQEFLLKEHIHYRLILQMINSKIRNDLVMCI